jgi:two-component system, OmpR family, alkaline phosphatase synthesis response regulator PhoP
MQKVLIAEDERDIRELVGFTLKLAGLETVYAANGFEAVDRAKADLPDLILMDLHMPGMEGDEAARQIAVDPLTKNIPIIFLTAKDQDLEISGQIGQGINFIAKPFAIESLTRRVKEALANNHK